MCFVNLKVVNCIFLKTGNGIKRKMDTTFLEERAPVDLQIVKFLHLCPANNLQLEEGGSQDCFFF